MAGALTINDGGLATKDPGDALTYEFRWGTRHLAPTALITNASFAITALRPADAVLVVKDQESLGVGTQTGKVRLSAGTVGALYRISHAIVTDENPPQTIERSFLLLIEQR